MKRSTLYAVLLAGCLVALLATFLFANAIQYRAFKSFQIGNINYNGAVGAKRIYLHAEDASSDLKSIDLTMSVEASSIHKYDNFFQTAPLNKGLRLELSKPSNLVLIAHAKNDSGYRPYLLTSNFRLNRWHKLSIKIDPQNHITIYFDGQLNASEMAPDLAYDISDVEIGAGFDTTRPFYGQIKDASISYQLIRQNSSAGTVTALRAIFIIGALVFLFLLSGLGKRREISDADNASVTDDPNPE